MRVADEIIIAMVQTSGEMFWAVVKQRVGERDVEARDHLIDELDSEAGTKAARRRAYMNGARRGRAVD